MAAQVGEGNKHRRAVKAEKQYMRMAIYPVLQAEEDRRWGISSLCCPLRAGRKGLCMGPIFHVCIAACYMVLRWCSAAQVCAGQGAGARE